MEEAATIGTPRAKRVIIVLKRLPITVRKVEGNVFAVGV